MCICAEDKGDTGRLEAEWTYIVNGFDPNEINRSKYIVGEYIEPIKEIITSQEQLNILVRANTNYRYKITYEDLDIGCGYFYVNLMGRVDNKATENRSLTVPTFKMVEWFKSLKEHGQIKRGCDRSKATAIRLILEHIEWLKCVDSNYDFINHVAMRYTFTEAFPKYQQFIQAVGQEVLDWITTDMRQEAG